MKTIVAVVLLTCVGSWAVTPEDITEQAAVVAAAQASLDSLSSLGHAEAWQTIIDSTDSLLTANRVTVEIVTIDPTLGAIRDPLYVDVDLSTAYASWGVNTRGNWALDLRTAGTGAIARTAGRYSVHDSDVQKFLDFTEAFIVSTEEED